MRSLERHRDVGAYALGVLDEADAFRFEDRLIRQCPRCATRMAEFGPTARQLMPYRRATPRPVHPVAHPGPGLLERLVSEVAVRWRTGRRRLSAAVAAALVCAAAGPGVALHAASRGQGSRIAATDIRSGVRAEVVAADREWGGDVAVTVADGAGPRACRLVAVGRDGTQETVTIWRVPGGDARPHTVRGTTTLHPGEIARYEVRTGDGRRLVTLPTG